MLRSDKGGLVSPRIISFIVKIWIDEGDDQPESPTWHGLVTQVPGGERRYVKQLSEIDDFVGSHLAKLGVRLGPERRLPP